MFQAISINSSHCWCLPSLSLSLSLVDPRLNLLCQHAGPGLVGKQQRGSLGGWPSRHLLGGWLAESLHVKMGEGWLGSRAWIIQLPPFAGLGSEEGADIGASLTQLFLEGVGASRTVRTSSSSTRTWEDYLYFSLWILGSFPFSAWRWPWVYLCWALRLTSALYSFEFIMGVGINRKEVGHYTTVTLLIQPIRSSHIYMYV